MLDASLRLRSSRVVKTPVVKMEHVFPWGQRVVLHLKLENLQRTGSFKARGATNFVMQSPGASRFVAHSAGNHGAALAWASKERGAQCTVVVPRTAPRAKVELIREYGAQVVETDHSKRTETVEAIVAGDPDAVVVHPFDDIKVMAGQGTIAVELVDQTEHLDSVVVPVSGGGMAAGITAVLEDKVVLVEPKGKRLMDALASKDRTLNGSPEPLDTVADGMRSRALGSLPWDALQNVRNVLTVDDDAILRAMIRTFEEAKTVCEPSGATALAGVLSADQHTFASCFGEKDTTHVGIIVCGGNLDVEPMLRTFYS